MTRLSARVRTLSARVRASPLLLALLSLSIMPKPAMRPARIATARPAYPDYRRGRS